MGRNLSIQQEFAALNGSPQYLGTIQSTGPNVISAISAAIHKGDQLMVQPDADGYILGGDHATTPTVVNSATAGVKVVADEKYYLCLKADDSPSNQNGEGYLQWISATGTTNLKVWRMV